MSFLILTLIYTTPSLANPSEIRQISVNLQANEQLGPRYVTPNGKYVLHLVRKTVSGNPFNTITYDVYRTRLSDDSTSKLLENIARNDLIITNDSRRVIYYRQEPGGNRGLFSKPIADGGVAIKLFDQTHSNQLLRIKQSPDGKYLVVKQQIIIYVDSIATTGQRISSVSVDEPGIIILDDGPECSPLFSFELTADSQHVVFVDEQCHLKIISPEGGTAKTLFDNADLTWFKVGPNGKYVAAMFGKEPYQRFTGKALYSALIEGGGKTLLSRSLASDEFISQATFNHAGTHLAYGVQREDEVYAIGLGPTGPPVYYFTYIFELYSVALVTPNSSLRLNSPDEVMRLPFENVVFEYSRDDEHIVYSLGRGKFILPDPSLYDLYKVRAHQQGSTKLRENIRDYKIASNGYVVYRASDAGLVSLDLSNDAFSTSDSLSFSDYQISTDGRQVAHQTVNSENKRHLVISSVDRMSDSRVIFESSAIGSFEFTPVNTSLIFSNYSPGLPPDEQAQYAVALQASLCQRNFHPEVVCSENNNGVNDWNTEASEYPGLEQIVEFSELSPITNLRIDLVGFVHDRLGDLSIQLIAPDGDTYNVVGPGLGEGPQGDDSDWRGEYAFQDDGGLLRLEALLRGSNERITPGTYNPVEDADGGLGVEQLNSFILTFVDGKRAPIGEWKLRFYDSNPEDGTGSLTSWRLSFNVDNASFFPIRVGGKTIMVLL